MSRAKLDELPWEEINETSEKGLFKQVFKKIPKVRFQFAAKEENREILVQAALRSLRKKDSDASFEQAVDLADLMQSFARRVIEV